MGETSITIASLLSDCGTILTKITELGTQVLNWIVSNPVMMVGFGLGIIGCAIGLVQKFRR